MEEQLHEDWLDAKLRDETPYLDDAGFTARVMAQLPAPQRARSLRSWIMLAMTLLGCAVAYFIGGAFVGENLAFLVAMPIWTICLMAGAVAMLVMVLGTAAAMRKAGDRRW